MKLIYWYVSYLHIRLVIIADIYENIAGKYLFCINKNLCVMRNIMKHHRLGISTKA